MRLRVLLVRLTLCLCLGTSAPSPAAAPPPPVRASPASAGGQLAARTCEVLHALPAQRRQACCGGAANHLAQVCTQALADSLARGAARVDEAQLALCAGSSASALEGCDWITPLQPALPEGCGLLIEGALAPGARCQSSLECGDGHYCRGLAPGQAGVCAPPAQPGARCELPADNLASFARARDDARHPVCNGACVRGQCLAHVVEGGQCASSAMCGPGLNCLGGRCQSRPLAALGESCGGVQECAGDSVCQDGRCSAPKAAGESCRLPFECRSLNCEKAPGSEAGVCSEACAAL